MNMKNEFYFKTMVTLTDIKKENPIYYDSCVMCKKKIKW